ncbi:MAG: DNA-binding response regulator [Gammaproteobacteria bacterium]|nr:MAG: DNA-binding response regulator [Gammaproteobacteria bacterium]
MIASYLVNHGYEVTSCHSGDRAIDTIRADAPDLVVLDIMLPGVDGLSVCRAVRNDFSGRILMLTALDDSTDEIAGLETGADDYIAKPVSPRLLLARIRSLLRRSTTDSGESHDGIDGNGHVGENDDDDCIGIGSLLVDRASRRVTVSGEDVRMTTTEFDLLWLLASNAGRILSREFLHESMYRLDLSPADRRIDLLVSRLRRKLGDDSSDPDRIKTVRGQGYLLSRG